MTVSPLNGGQALARMQPVRPPATRVTSRSLRARWLRAMNSSSFGRVAHLDRVPASEAGGSGFESRRAHCCNSLIF